MTIKSLLSTVSLALLIGGGFRHARRRRSRSAISPIYSGATSDVGTPYGQAVADTFAWVNKNGGVGGKQLARRHQRLRLPGAARDRALQEMVGAGRQGRGDHGLGHRRYRSADRLRRPGQDPLHLRLLCSGADRPGRRQRQGEARALQFLLRPELFRRDARDDDLGGRGLEGQGQARQAEIRPHGRQPSLPERAEGRG